MEFKLKFNIDNASFFQDGWMDTEIKRILNQIKKQIDFGYTGQGVFDLNGNKIGEWSMT